MGAKVGFLRKLKIKNEEIKNSNGGVSIHGK
jgi:hypothetical protein